MPYPYRLNGGNGEIRWVERWNFAARTTSERSPSRQRSRWRQTRTTLHHERQRVSRCRDREYRFDRRIEARSVIHSSREAAVQAFHRTPIVGLRT